MVTKFDDFIIIIISIIIKHTISNLEWHRIELKQLLQNIKKIQKIYKRYYKWLCICRRNIMNFKIIYGM